MPATQITDILIVGTGFSGLGVAIKLRAAGFDRLILIEKAADVGGTWRDNTYPGCACDIPSHLYSLSFAPKADWSRMYPLQPELYEYMRAVADEHNLRPLIQFNTAFEKAVWDEAASLWRITTSAGEITSRVLISGVGALHIPAIPRLKGLENFAGKMFHSAQWDKTYNLAGKRVAVIGTGASAIQFVPQIAPQAAKLHLFQRTAPWIMPKPDRAFSEREKQRFTNPFYRRLFRHWLFWRQEVQVLSFLNKHARNFASKLPRSYLQRKVKDPVLRAKLTPDYQMGCKRVLFSNDYYPALQHPNVEVITDGIAEIGTHSMLDNQGIEREIDAIIFGTGFKVTDSYKHINITGLGGKSLAAIWDATGMEAYKGISIAGFPNYFMLLGPSTGLGHNSVVLMIEAQVNYIVDALKRMRAGNVAVMDVCKSVQNAFAADIQHRLRNTVWTDGGCKSWYQDSSGKITAIWPGSVISYRKATTQADLRDYDLLTTQAAKITN